MVSSSSARKLSLIEIGNAFGKLSNHSVVRASTSSNVTFPFLVSSPFSSSSFTISCKRLLFSSSLKNDGCSEVSFCCRALCLFSVCCAAAFSRNLGILTLSCTRIFSTFSGIFRMKKKMLVKKILNFTIRVPFSSSNRLS